MFTRGVGSICLLACFCGGVTLQAAQVTWYLNGVAFNDGGRAFGSFVYDADTNSYTSINITTTKGSIWPGTNHVYGIPAYGSATHVDAMNSSPIVASQTTFFDFDLASPLTNAGGAVSINTAGSLYVGGQVRRWRV